MFYEVDLFLHREKEQSLYEINNFCEVINQLTDISITILYISKSKQFFSLLNL